MPPADLDDSPAPAPPPNRPKKMEKCQLQATDALLDGVLAHLRTDDESPKPKSLEAIASLIHDFDPDKPERESASPTLGSVPAEKNRGSGRKLSVGPQAAIPEGVPDGEASAVKKQVSIEVPAPEPSTKSPPFALTEEWTKLIAVLCAPTPNRCRDPPTAD